MYENLSVDPKNEILDFTYVGLIGMGNNRTVGASETVAVASSQA
jgi:hypothetical protein